MWNETFYLLREIICYPLNMSQDFITTSQPLKNVSFTVPDGCVSVLVGQMGQVRAHCLNASWAFLRYDGYFHGRDFNASVGGVNTLAMSLKCLLFTPS